MLWFDLVLLILASYRLTHLLVFDSITEPLRERLAPVRFVGELISCYWCCGVWVSAFCVALLLLWPVVARPFLLIFAVAAGQALLETLFKRD